MISALRRRVVHAFDRSHYQSDAGIESMVALSLLFWSQGGYDDRLSSGIMHALCGYTLPSLLRFDVVREHHRIGCGLKDLVQTRADMFVEGTDGLFVAFSGASGVRNTHSLER